MQKVIGAFIVLFTTCGLSVSSARAGCDWIRGKRCLTEVYRCSVPQLPVPTVFQGYLDSFDVSEAGAKYELEMRCGSLDPLLMCAGPVFCKDATQRVCK